MKNLKKVLALVVALTMVFTTVAFASYPDVDAAADYAGAVELLSALDILKGDDNGNFNPDNTITRAEFAAVVCRALGWETSANGAKGTTQFTDVAADHWASGYINLAAQQGIVNGKGNGIFDPEGNVTFTEAVKMLVVAIGYEPMAEQKGGWPTGYLTVANSIKMTAGVPATGTDAAALRSTVAMLTANAIEIPVMDQVSYGTLTEYKPLNSASNYKSLLYAMDIHKVVGVIDEVYEADGEFAFSIKMPPEDYEFHYYDNTGKLVADLTQKRFKIADSNVADYVGAHVNMYIKEIRKDTDYEAIIVMPSGIGSTDEIAIDQLVTGNNAITGQTYTFIDSNNENVYEYYETKDATRTSKIYVDENPTVKVNGVVVNKGGFYVNNAGNSVPNTPVITDLCEAEWIGDATHDPRNVVFTFIENDNDKYYDIIDINIIDYAIVESVLADKERIEFVNSTKVTFDFDDSQQVVEIYNAEGAEIALEDINAGDILAIQVSEINSTQYSAKLPVPYSSFTEKITIYDLGESSVVGTVTGWDDSEEILYIDGEAYEYTTLPWVTSDDATTLMGNGNNPLGTDGTFYLGKDGKIIGYDGTLGGAGNYGFIIDAYDNQSGFEHQWQLKVLTIDGGIVTYNVDTKCKIDGTYYEKTASSDAQSTFFTAGKYNNVITPNVQLSQKYVNIDNNVIDFDTNRDGEIDEITFVMSKPNVRAVSIDASTAEYKASTNKLGGKSIEDTLVIFNVKTPDALDATVLDASTLVDEGVYGGRLFDVNNDKEYDIFVMQDGVAAFDAESNFFVVDSVARTTYGEDAEDAILVNYYTEGSNELLQAYITGDSNDVLSDKATVGNSYVYNEDSLGKGSIFVANVSESGLVNDFAVIAVVNNGTYLFNDIQPNPVAGAPARTGSVGDLRQLTIDIFGSTEVDKKTEKTELVLGYITGIKGKVVTLGGSVDPNFNYANGATPSYKDYINGRDFTIDASVAQYCFNNDNANKPRVISGDYRSKNVDTFNTVTRDATLVLLKVYDDEVTDIVSISTRVSGFGITAQTHWTVVNGVPAAGPELNSVAGVEVEVKAEEIVVEEEIIFE